MIGKFLHGQDSGIFCDPLVNLHDCAIGDTRRVSNIAEGTLMLGQLRSDKCEKVSVHGPSIMQKWIADVKPQMVWAICSHHGMQNAKRPTRDVLAENLRFLMSSYPDRGTQIRVIDVAKRKGRAMSQSTVSRALRAEVDVDLGTLDALSVVFDIEPWRLVTENLGNYGLKDIRIGGLPMPSAASDAVVSKSIKPAPKQTRRVKT